MAEKDMFIPSFHGDLSDVKPTKQLPVYLITFERGLKTKTLAYFVCNKVDKFATHLEFIGVEIKEPDILKTTTDYQSMIVRSQLQEICVPWHRSHEIKTLTFKK
jgi:hypothetical protein